MMWKILAYKIQLSCVCFSCIPVRRGKKSKTATCRNSLHIRWSSCLAYIFAFTHQLYYLSILLLISNSFIFGLYFLAHRNALNNTFMNGKKDSQIILHKEHVFDVSVLYLGDIRSSRNVCFLDTFNPFFVGTKLPRYLYTFVLVSFTHVPWHLWGS